MIVTGVTNCDTGWHSLHEDDENWKYKTSVLELLRALQIRFDIAHQLQQVWCGGHPPQRQPEANMDSNIWWKWIKWQWQVTDNLQIILIILVCGMFAPPLSGTDATATEFVPGGLSSCVPYSTFCQIFNSSDFETKTYLPSKTSILKVEVIQIDANLPAIILLHPPDHAIGQVITIIPNELPQVDHIRWAVRQQKRCELQKEEGW